MTLASRQTSRSTGGAVGADLADDRERVDLDEVGVVGPHRRDEALGDRDGRLEVPAEAHRERQLARLEVEQPEERVRVAPDDGFGMRPRRRLSISTPPSAEPISRIRRSARSSTAAR